MSIIFVATILYYTIGTKGNLISTHSPYTGESSYGHGWNSTIKLYLQNVGCGASTISDFVINGKSYSSYNPVPSVNPSIEKGYKVSPFQSITFTIKLINQPSALYQGGNELYVLATDGQSLRMYLGS